mgnify:CR=1 FL=1
MNKPIIASPQVTNHILHRFKLRADKKLGQNFLIDENIVRRIVEAAELSPADKVLEVGPGIGTLTQGLAESGADVVAVELDKRCYRYWMLRWRVMTMFASSMAISCR